MDEIIYLIQKFLTFITVPFLELVNLSITAGWIVLAVILIRLIFKKAPKWLNCVLWGIVALRLIFPFSLESVFSLIPSAQTIDPTLPYLNEFEINSGIEPLDNAVNTHYADFVPVAERTVDVTIILACVWLLGVGIMLIYAFASWARLKINLKTATKKEGNIYQSEFVQSPFVLGIIRPKIYIPYKTNESDLPLVIAHEKAHIKRLDHLIKPLGFILLSIYWFNPLLWVAYILLCRDIEAACDEKVIKQLTDEQRKDYSMALLNASISRKSIAACPLAFGETGVKERIKGVMNYKKPAFWVIIAAVAVCIIAAVCFLTNPTETERTDYSPNISNELDRLISVNVIEHNQGYYLDGLVSCEAHKVLATETTSEDDENGIAITVYLVSSYNEYSVEDGQLVEKGGNMTPLALSFVVDGEDSYALYDYWEPGMGSSYIKDLQAKFPAGVDYDTQSYVKELEAECIRQAMDYFGLSESDITEQSTKELTTVMLEAKTDYELTVKKSKSSGVTWMTDESFYQKNGYHAYLYCLDEAYIALDGKNIYIGDVLNSGKLSIDALIKKAEEDAKSGKAKTDMLKDGGTKFYWYDDYTIIKRNTLGSNSADARNQDLIIGYADMSTTEYSAAVEFINNSMKNHVEATTFVPDDIVGVTAPVGYDDEPHFDAVIVENNGSSLLVKAYGDNAGIAEGTQAYVNLKSVLSHIELPEMKKGDKVRFIYDGTIQETYPLQIPTVWAVYELK